MTAKDFLGKDIKVGDTVCYPVRRGSKMEMKKIVVQTIVDTPKGICITSTSNKGRPINIYNLQNCVRA